MFSCVMLLILKCCPLIDWCFWLNQSTQKVSSYPCINPVSPEKNKVIKCQRASSVSSHSHNGTKTIFDRFVISLQHFFFLPTRSGKLPSDVFLTHLLSFTFSLSGSTLSALRHVCALLCAQKRTSHENIL